MDVNTNSITTVCHQHSAWRKRWTYCWDTGTVAVADLEVQIRWGGGWSSRPWDKGGGVSKNCFSGLRASVWSKSNGGWGARAPSLDPPLCGHVTGRSRVEYSVWDNHVVWSEANYYYSWLLAKYSTRKLVNKGTLTRIYLWELQRKLTQILFGLF